LNTKIPLFFRRNKQKIIFFAYATGIKMCGPFLKETATYFYFGEAAG
jgi:hypothetical protein